MPPPRGVLCDLCGQKFFKHSLPIHRKQCAIKMKNAFTECPKCLRKVSNDEYGKHVAECTIVRSKAPKIKPPRDVLCDICGQKFFKHSLPIHRKQCLVKREQCFSECPKCLRRVSNDEYGTHVEECKIVRDKATAKKATSMEKEVALTDANVEKVDTSQRKEDHGEKTIKGESRQVDEESSSDEEKDARIACGFCNRKFNPDRISKHEKICQTNHSRKPRKQFKSTEQARLEGTDFAKYKNARREVDKLPSRWREQHARLLNTVQQGRLVDQFKASGIPLSMLPSPNANLEAIAEGNPDSSHDNAQRKAEQEVAQGMTKCPHCSRTFSDTTAVKHIPKCKTTLNRPKRLVRKSKPVLEKPKTDFTKKIKDIVRSVLFSKKKKSDYFETKQAGLYRDGERVMLKDGRVGEIKYIGQVEELFPGYWVGLCLESPRGQNNGSINGHSYFSCPMNRGVFVRPSKLTKVPIEKLLNQAEKSKAKEVPESNETTKAPAKTTPESISVQGNTVAPESKDPREACGICNRKFNPDRIAAHEKICNASKLRAKARGAAKGKTSGGRSGIPVPKLSVRKKSTSVVDRLREEVRANSPRQEQP